MEFHKSYIHNDKILFDIWLVDAYPEMNTGILTINSNIPNALINREYPQAEDDLNEIDSSDEKSITSFINKLCEIISKTKDARYFYWPEYSISRDYNDEAFFDFLKTFDVDEDLVPDTVYSQNCNGDQFYVISREFSYYRIFTESTFAETVKLIGREEFESYLPAQFGEEYMLFYSLNNLFYCGIEDNCLQFIMTSEHYDPLLFFMIEEDQQLTKPKNNPTGR